MRFRHFTRGDPDSHTWEREVGHRGGNGGLGMCNTGSGKRVICGLGGIGCDVDHLSVAELNLQYAIDGWGDFLSQVDRIVYPEAGS